MAINVADSLQDTWELPYNCSRIKDNSLWHGVSVSFDAELCLQKLQTKHEDMH